MINNKQIYSFLESRNDLSKLIRFLPKIIRKKIFFYYDWAAIKAIEKAKSYSILKEEIVKKYGEETLKELQRAEAYRYKEVFKASEEYSIAIYQKEKIINKGEQ